MTQNEAVKKLKDHVTEKHNEFVDSLESVRTIIKGADVSDELKNKIFSFIDDTSVSESEYVDKKIQPLTDKDEFTNLLMEEIDVDFGLFRLRHKSMVSSLFGHTSDICEQLRNIFN